MSNSLHLPPAILNYIDPTCLERDELGRSSAQVFDAGRRFLKIAPRGELARAAAMQAYFARKGLSAPLVAYEQDDMRDYLVVEAVPGQNACRCMDDPAWLAAAIGEAVRALHETDAADCPLRDVNVRAIDAYARETGRAFDGDTSILKDDALLQGDCCLPNIFFEGRRFAGFIDLGEGGVGDRHFDLCWALWSLNYNLKTPRFNDRLLDAYGRDAVDDQRLALCTALSQWDR